MKRRANNEGSLFYSEASGYWIAEVVLPDGRKRRKRHKLQRVVKDWLEQQKRSIRDETWIADSSTRYGDYLDRYMAEVAAHTLKPKTIENYYFVIKNHIKPDLGELKLNQIRPEHLQKLYAKKLSNGFSKYTVVYIHRIVHKTLSTALRWGLVARNVADAVTPPTPDNKEITPLTVEEVKRLLTVLEGDRLYAYYVLLCSTGMRKGEGLGLQKSSLNLEDGTVIVRHNLSSVRGKGLILGEPKSQKSRRELALPPFCVQALKDHLEKYPSTSAYVFATSHGTPFSPRNILRHFKGKLKEAGLPEETRIHDLRHSFISWLLTNTPISDVQAIAGHSQIQTTIGIYGHLMPGAKRAAADKIEKMFE